MVSARERPGTYTAVVLRIRDKLEKKYRDFGIELKIVPGWTSARTLIEFIDWCIDHKDCREVLRELVRTYREQFVLETMFDPTYLKIVAQSKI